MEKADIIFTTYFCGIIKLLRSELIALTQLHTSLTSVLAWAYDLKTVPMSVVKKRVERTGDGTHEIWGWGDKDMTTSDKNLVHVINKSVM